MIKDNEKRKKRIFKDEGENNGSIQSKPWRDVYKENHLEQSHFYYILFSEISEPNVSREYFEK